MDRHLRRALRERGGYDWDVHRRTLLRNREQIAALPDPEYPATGTRRIGALVAEARRRRDEAYLAACTEGGAGLRTGRPLDTRLPTAVPTPGDGAERDEAERDGAERAYGAERTATTSP